MKNNLERFKKNFGILTIVFAIMFVFSLIVVDNMPARNPLFDTFYALMWIGLGCTPLFAILWFVFKTKDDEAFAEENRIKWEEQRKIEEAKREQQKAEAKKAYEEISDIWEYGEKTMLAVAASKLEEIGIGGGIYYVKLKYTNNNSTPWVITINDPTGDINSDFKVQRKGNSLIGALKNDKIIIMTKGQLTFDDSMFLFDTKSEHVREISELMKELLNGKKLKLLD